MILRGKAGIGCLVNLEIYHALNAENFVNLGYTLKKYVIKAIKLKERMPIITMVVAVRDV